MTPKMAHECLVCGTALEGPLGLLFHLFGITRSPRNPNVCNRCEAHMQEGVRMSSSAEILTSSPPNPTP